MVIVNFIRDKEVGLFARAKRLAKNGSVGRAGLLVKTVKCNGGDSSVLQDGNDRISETGESDKSEWYPPCLPFCSFFLVLIDHENIWHL